MKQNNVERVFIVNQEMYVIGGCCPDLPDSVSLKQEDAEKRVNELYKHAYKYCVDGGIEIDKTKTYCNADECVVQSVNEKIFYFKAYIIGTCPLIKDFDNDWKELNNELNFIPGKT